MIKKLVVRNVASYDGSEHMLELKKINYVYGANGSGKTTISRVLRDPESYPNCTLERDPGDHVPILVYNRDFVQENLSVYEGIKSVFSMGVENVKQHDDIHNLEHEISAIEKRIGGLEASLNGIPGNNGVITHRANKWISFKEFCWETILKKNKVKFGEAFRGCMTKESFAERTLVELANNAKLQTLEYLENTAGIVFAPDQPKLDRIVMPDFSMINKIMADAIWSRIIVGSSDVDMAGMIAVLGNADWVEKGRKYLSLTNGTCPFCHQPAPHLKEQLEAYFDKSYDSAIAEAKRLALDFKAEVDALIIQLQNAAQGREKFLDREAFDKSVEAVKKRIGDIITQMELKLDNPGMAIRIPGCESERIALERVIVDANKAIDHHNELIDNKRNLQIELVSEVWRYLIEEHKLAIKTYKKEIDGLDSAIANIKSKKDSAQRELIEKKAELAMKNSQLVSVLPTVDKINKLLKTLGFTRFSLAEGENATYRIVRPDGSTVMCGSLSEGERSFLAFLYFYHVANGGLTVDDVGADRIVVVDDPVSSMDGEVLFVVSVLVRRMINSVVKGQASKIRQIVILTHNVHFHKEVTFDAKRNVNSLEYETFHIVRKSELTSDIIGCNGNPIKSSYELLWEDVRFADTRTDVAVVRNAMRRILEYYFTFLGGESLNDVMEQLPDDDKPAGLSLLMWLHDGSHTAGEDLYCTVNNETVDMYRRVFERIFEIKDQKSHYEMMMRTVGD